MPVATAAVTSLWRAVVVLRVLTAAFVVGSIIAGGFVRPDSGWLVLAAIAVWTAVICLAYSYDVTRRSSVIVLDLLVTLALPVSSVLVFAPEQLSAGTALLTTVWYSGPVLAAAVHAGRLAGLLFGVVVCVVNLWILGLSSGRSPGGAAGNGVAQLVGELVLLGGIGYMLGLAATTARRATEQLRRAARIEAAVAQRTRLARSVHDIAGSDDVDLAAALRLLAGSRVDVVVPAAEVPLPACDVEELVAVIREVLADSADRPDIKALVLVEDLGAEVVLTVRDEAPRPTDVRLAEANGRAGAPRSIRGRVADLGATLTLETRPGRGTEWEVRVPRVPRATVDE